MTEEILTINEQQYLIRYENELTNEQRNSVISQLTLQGEIEEPIVDDEINKVETPLDQSISSLSLIYNNHFKSTTLDPKLIRFGNTTWTNWTAASIYNVVPYYPDSTSPGYVRLKLTRNPNYNSNCGCTSSNNCCKKYVGSGFDIRGSPFKYGRVDIRARFPYSNAGNVGYICLWPNSPSSWPPEIDFAETDGIRSETTTFTQHYKESNVHKMLVKTLTSFTVNSFHVYTVIVTSTEVKWYVDGVWKLTQPNKSPGQYWEYSCGLWAGNCSGNWGGCPTFTTTKYLDIDYLKIYKQV